LFIRVDLHFNDMLEPKEEIITHAYLIFKFNMQGLRGLFISFALSLVIRDINKKSFSARAELQYNDKSIRVIFVVHR